MRGKRYDRLWTLLIPRLIPAHAGKTAEVARIARRFTAHPRACGENEAKINGTWVEPGSSPRMRGKLQKQLGKPWKNGLIPAHAGKTPGGAVSDGPDGAHPRACGENFVMTFHRLPTRGSSPRMRGKQLRLRARHLQGRLIPAHAGKTSPVASASAFSRAHPRACGENAEVLETALIIAGSSPRMRGKRSRRPRSLPAGGLIPAHAGKTRSITGSPVRTAAHPRACGENH